jgi:hypothetical protein
MATARGEVPIEDPNAQLERAFMDEYLRTQGHQLRTLHALPADQVKTLLRAATLYAAVKLAEVEARASYVHDIHGVASE